MAEAPSYLETNYIRWFPTRHWQRAPYGSEGLVIDVSKPDKPLLNS